MGFAIDKKGADGYNYICINLFSGQIWKGRCFVYNSAVCLLDRACEKYPNKTAVVDEWGEITFLQLKQRAMRVASFLLKNKNNSKAPVVVYMKKSIECIVSFMAVLYSGRAYVPVASDMPLNRVKKITDNLNPSYIIADEQRMEILKQSENMSENAVLFSEAERCVADEEKIKNVLDCVIDTDPIYIMYTSGSTGDPKGVTVSHKGVIDYVTWTKTEFGFSENDIFGNQAPFYFDNSIFDIYGCLICGATMVIIPEVLFNFQNKLPEYVKEKKITVIFWVPTILINVANSGALDECEMTDLKKVLFCGEVMPNTQLNIWRKHYPNLMYANLYGPTEITDVCTYYIVDRPFENSEPLPIGRACKNMRTYIITEDGNAAKPNEIGELCVSGTGVSLGYYNNKEITDKVFIQNPFNPYYAERLYRTGDLVYETEDGLIMYVGRMDSQIKINGNRVELGEIENAAMCIEGVSGAVAALDSEKNAIALFLETKNDYKLRHINLELKKHIPKYMLPGELFLLEKFPHTPNDKIDRVSLKKMLCGKDGEK